MNILLVNPPWQFRDYIKLPPLGILYLASYLRDHGHEVDVLDLNLEVNNPVNFLSESITRINHYSPDIIDKHNHCWDAVRYGLSPVIKPQKEARVF